MRLSWESVAPWYDAQLWLERSALRVALELAAVSPDSRVLDVGTGTGAVLCELARRGDRPGWVLGVDRSDAMLARVPSLPLGWRVQRADARRLPVADASVDVAVASFLLHLLSERKRLACLCELRRIVAPGGRVVVVIPGYPQGRVLRVGYRALLGALAAIGSHLRATLVPVDLAAQITAAGFRVAESGRSRWGYPAICLLLTPTEAPL